MLFRSVKTKATSGETASKKAGAKGTAGIDWVVKLGGEVTGEIGKENTKSKEEEYTVVFPEGALDVALSK